MKTNASILLLLASTAIAAPTRPAFEIYQSRTKQHRQFSPTGDLIEGQEHLRKMILGWYRIDGAVDYELCHQCVGRIDESTGEEAGSSEVGTVLTEIDECGTEPCLVFPAMPMGLNSFHLRYRDGDEWSPWSEKRTFDIGMDLGKVIAEELKHEEL